MAPASHPEVRVLSNRNGSKALITGAANNMVHLSIVPTNGKVVHREVFSGSNNPVITYSWNGGPLLRGVYFIRVETSRGTAATKFVLF